MSEFVRPEVHEKYQFKEIPYVDDMASVSLVPLTLDVTETMEGCWVSAYTLYKDGDRVYKDENAAWEIRVGVDVYYVVVYEMEDPSCGFLGALGRWIPFQTVLYDANKELISEHSETEGVDHLRITSCSTAETMIRYLTVWGMIDSLYKPEIQQLNDRLRNCYKTMFKTRDLLLELYGKREAVDPNKYIELHSINNFTYERFLKYNGDLQ